jgi:hypothetical protein
MQRDLARSGNSRLTITAKGVDYLEQQFKISHRRRRRRAECLSGGRIRHTLDAFAQLRAARQAPRSSPDRLGRQVVSHFRHGSVAVGFDEQIVATAHSPVS